MATQITNDNYTTQEKLQILADASKYDVACTSSGSGIGPKSASHITYTRRYGIHGKYNILMKLIHR